MKRKELSLKLARHHQIRHGMLEDHQITLEQFTEEQMNIIEEFMVARAVRVRIDTPDGDIPMMVNQWEDNG